MANRKMSLSGTEGAQRRPSQQEDSDKMESDMGRRVNGYPQSRSDFNLICPERRIKYSSGVIDSIANPIGEEWFRRDATRSLNG